VLADTMTAYLDDLSSRLAPRSVAAAEVCLRDFSLHVLATNGSCRSARDVTASHVADWCAGLAERPVSAETINYKLDVLRRFFEHLHDHGHRDAPAEIPIVRRPRPPRPPGALRPVSVGPVQKPKAKKPRVPEPKPPSRALPRETTWEEIALRAPRMAATMTAYLEQTTVSHRTSSVQAYSLALRHLAAHVTATDANCVAVADIGRGHIEGYKLALAARQGWKGNVTTTTIRHNLGMIRTFFE
jgi:site-specific recombinase XerD